MLITIDYSESEAGVQHTADMLEGKSVAPISYSDWTNTHSYKEFTYIGEVFNSVTGEFEPVTRQGVADGRGLGLFYDHQPILWGPTDNYVYFGLGNFSPTSIILDPIKIKVFMLNHYPDVGGVRLDDGRIADHFSNFSEANTAVLVWQQQITAWYNTVTLREVTHFILEGLNFNADVTLSDPIVAGNLPALLEVDADTDITGTRFNDTISGGLQNDRYKVNGGVDTFDGNTGDRDMAVFSGNEKTYTITAQQRSSLMYRPQDTVITVTSNVISEQAILTGVEYRAFSNGAFEISNSTLTTLASAKQFIDDLKELMDRLLSDDVDKFNVKKYMSFGLDMAAGFTDLWLGHETGQAYAAGKGFFVNILMMPVDALLEPVEEELPPGTTWMIGLVKDEIRDDLGLVYDGIQNGIRPAVDAAAEFYGDLIYSQNRIDSIVRETAQKEGIPEDSSKHFIEGTGIDAPDDLDLQESPVVAPPLSSIAPDNTPGDYDFSSSPTSASVAGGGGGDQIFGSAQPDFLAGGAGGDSIAGKLGDDLISGGTGLDTAIFDFGRRAYQITSSPSSNGPAFVLAGPEGSDGLVDIEVLKFVDGRLTFDVDDPAAQIYRIYEATLGRAADNLGLSNWVDSIEKQHSGLPEIVSGFTNSAEFQSTYGSLDNEQFVELLYGNVLGRASDAEGKTNWLAVLDAGNSRESVVLGFSESLEFKNTIATQTADGIWVQDNDAASIARLYYATLDRAPDVGGLRNWTETLEAGTPLDTIAGGFTNSLEFQSRYGALDNSAFIDLLYQNVLDRPADTEGKGNWLATLSSGVSRENVVLGFSESQEFQLKTQPLLDDGFLVT